LERSKKRCGAKVNLAIRKAPAKELSARSRRTVKKKKKKKARSNNTVKKQQRGKKAPISEEKPQRKMRERGGKK